MLQIFLDLIGRKAYNKCKRCSEQMDQNHQAIPDEILQQRAIHGDCAAEEMLVIRYGRLVRICARPYFLAGGDSEDLTQEGMLGLLSAIREYDMAMSASFKTFAELCIKRRILSAVKKSSPQKACPIKRGDFFGANAL